MKIGQQVWWVKVRTIHHAGYCGGWDDEVNHDSITGRVVSHGDGVVVVLPDGKKRLVFLEDHEVLLTEGAARETVAAANLDMFGHKDGKWAAEAVKKAASPPAPAPGGRP